MKEENCAQCGTPASPGAKFCESCGAPFTREEGQPPRAVRTQEPAYGAPQYVPPPGYAARRGPSATAPYEGVSIRFVAILIDTVVIGAVSSILTAPFFAFSLTRLATRAALFGPAVATRALIALVIYFLYFTLLEGHYGQTVGKMAVKIRVVRETDGSPIDYGEAAVRTVLRIIDGLFAYLVGGNPDLVIGQEAASRRSGCTHCRRKSVMGRRSFFVTPGALPFGRDEAADTRRSWGVYQSLY